MTKYKRARSGARREQAAVEGAGRGLRELAAWDQVFRALAHSSRRHILQVLCFRGAEMSAGQIAARFHCSWPTITRHLAGLVKAGLVRVEKQGRERRYRLERAHLVASVHGWLRCFEPPARGEPS